MGHEERCFWITDVCFSMLVIPAKAGIQVHRVAARPTFCLTTNQTADERRCRGSIVNCHSSIVNSKVFLTLTFLILHSQFSILHFPPWRIFGLRIRVVTCKLIDAVEIRRLKPGRTVLRRARQWQDAQRDGV
jgi:hypothetical protein